MVNISFLRTVCRIIVTATFPGAQTERRGDAGPVRDLLGGKDLIGRLLLPFLPPNYSKLTG
jgi:hypothetical protein